ncbi:hypothetical protein PMIN06_008972 [Paraphaeosphaeria minitans]
MPNVGTWKSCDAGVAVFVPDENCAPSVEEFPPVSMFSSYRSIGFQSNSDGFADKRTNVQSSHAVRRLLNSLSLNTVPNHRADFPSTIQGDDTKTILTPMSSASGSSREWYQQLEQSVNGGYRPLQNFGHLTKSPKDTEGYNSDRTDFLLDDPETPCPKRTVLLDQQKSIRLSSHPKERTMKNQGNLKQPNFGQKVVRKRTSSSTKKPHKLSEAQQALEDLKNSEYIKRHFWTDQQRYDLAILTSFFEGNAADMTKVFNKMHRLNLDTVKQLKPQEIYLKRNAEAFPFCHKIFTWPPNDPNNAFAEDRAAILKAASSVGVVLEPRQEEHILSSGSAKSARSKYTRRRFELLMRKARHKNSPPSGSRLQPHTVLPLPKLGGIAISTSSAEEVEVNTQDDEHHSVYMSEGTTPKSADSPRQRPQQPVHLAFRVWDRHSHTKFDTERGFVSALHSIWNGPLLPTPQLDTLDGRNSHLLLSNTHLSRTGNASAYISVATSLVQALNYAMAMEDPQIAVVDLSAASLQEPWKKLRASDLLRELKAMGQARWARYRGTAEIMIFGSLPMDDAITFHGSLTDLAAVVTAQPAGKMLLNPNEFKPDQAVSGLTGALKAKDIRLTPDLARSMAVFAKSMGLTSPRISPEHTAEFVQVIIDGWSIAIPDNMQERSLLAQAFAHELGSQTLPPQDVENAFITGLERGASNMAYYSRCQKSSFRRRRRHRS